LNLRKGWYKASNGYIYIWEPDHPNADRRGYVAEHTKAWLRCSGGLFYQRKRCIIATGKETTIGPRILSCGPVASNLQELESATW
jgi:hypothetical protein